MLIRHAESVQNKHMRGVMERLRTGDIAAKPFNEQMRRGPPGAHGGADAELTPLGLEQADMLGAAWAPALSAAAAAGKLRVYVSPFIRTMRTADPLLRRVVAAVPGFQATVLPAVMEEGVCGGCGVGVWVWVWVCVCVCVCGCVGVCGWVWVWVGVFPYVCVPPWRGGGRRRGLACG